MTIRHCIFALLVVPALGCSDIATIGGLCVFDCGPADGGAIDSGGVCGKLGCDSGVDDGGEDRDDGGIVCSTGSFELTRMRTDLMLVVDDSISLGPWWPALSDGLIQFLQTTEASGLAVGLQRFDEICEAEPYSVPLVAIAPIADNRQALLQALPTGVVSTSTVPALDGVLRHARGWAIDHPISRVAVVLLTDASPGACDGLVGDYDGEAQRLARDAYQGIPSIETYVIGFGPLPGPAALGPAGGTAAIPIGITPADGEVVAALESVRRAAQPCAFQWQPAWTPASDSAVLVVASDGTEQRIPILSNGSACAQGDGFYVADLSEPYPLIACATTCKNLRASDRISLTRACVKL